MHSAIPTDRLIDMSTVTKMLQRSRATIYRDIGRSEFPGPLKLGRSSRWRLSEVMAYIEARSESRFGD
ncbi:helix-turn-helix transcriptional regulator [Pikeienuella sp. HZG-20]|uniref:helix-turn-helix transcriptional regulator n=1 Tax=Paludibacillus litoralis TaxID=3133267 RepID=UPI0030EC4B6C